LFCNAINREKNKALHRANMSPVLILKPFPAQVIRYMPIIAESARVIVLAVGHFFSRTAIISGVITMESWTIKAVFEPEVLFSASMQKVLLTTDTRLIKALVIIIFLLKFFSCFLNII